MRTAVLESASSKFTLFLRWTSRFLTGFGLMVSWVLFATLCWQSGIINYDAELQGKYVVVFVLLTILVFGYMGSLGYRTEVLGTMFAALLITCTPFFIGASNWYVLLVITGAVSFALALITYLGYWITVPKLQVDPRPKKINHMSHPESEPE
jgi:hypothetical protein